MLNYPKFKIVHNFETFNLAFFNILELRIIIFTFYKILVSNVHVGTFQV